MLTTAGPGLRTVPHDHLSGVPAVQHAQERVHDVLEPVHHRLVQRQPAALQVGNRELAQLVLAIATLDGARLPAGLVARGLFEESYFLVHPAGHPAPRSLPLVDWGENCGSYTRAWWGAQDWIARATIEAEDGGAVLSLVSGGTEWRSCPHSPCSGHLTRSRSPISVRGARRAVSAM
ncbi:hypothetical protein SBRY_40118 [Actinacidiphila bryophytorum]|uniref:Uncharacterized protein n=1 Tax=Actinacidiphila bryophytorum TaxID=1436133 RepID=A0A9W4H294_9ACTN|nr:hypothetical protein SBRY_40118 [Actinacidiphila bryophytorum]